MQLESGSRSFWKVPAALSAAAAATLLGVSLCTPQVAKAAASDFSDTPAGAWYVDEGWIDYASDNGLMTGYSNGPDAGKFLPEKDITRAEAATIIYRMATGATGNAPAPETTSFSDVATADWYAGAIEWCKANGIVTGFTEGPDAGKFKPQDTVTRGQLAAMAYRLAQLKNLSGVDNPDPSNYEKAADAGDEYEFATEPLKWTAANDLLSGNKHQDGSLTFESNNPTTRAQAAKVFSQEDKLIDAGGTPVEKLTVTFEDGQGNVIKSYQLERGAAIPDPGEPTRDGYTFKGWSPEFKAGDVVSGNVTYTAQWQADKPAPEASALVTLNVGRHVDTSGNETAFGTYLDDLKLNYYGAGVYVVGFTGTDTSVKVPAQVDGQPVVSVQLTNKNENKGLTSLDLSAAAPTLAGVNLDGLTSLQTLDLKGASKLVDLSVSNNKAGSLASLDLSGATSLQSLAVSGNKLTSLDLSGLTSLQRVAANDNALTTLSVKGDAALWQLNASANQLTSVDLTGASGLKSLHLQDNQLSALDVSGSPELETLNVENNKLSELDLTKNPKFTEGQPKDLYFDDGVKVSYHTVALQVAAKDMTVQATGEPVPFVFSAPEGVDASTFTVTYLDASGKQLDGAPSEAGEYTVRLHRDAQGGYAAFDGTYKLTITAAPVEQSDFAYDYITAPEGTKVGVPGELLTVHAADGSTSTRYGVYWGDGIYVQGLSEAGKAKKDIVVPAQIDGQPVVSVLLSGDADLSWGTSYDSLDASAASSLVALSAVDMGFSSVDVSGAPALQSLDLHMNPKLAELDLTANPLLTKDNVTVDASTKVTFAGEQPAPQEDNFVSEYITAPEGTELGAKGVELTVHAADGSTSTRYGQYWGDGVYVTSFKDSSKIDGTVTVPAEIGGQPVVSVNLSGYGKPSVTQIDLSQATGLAFLSLQDFDVASLDVTASAGLRQLSVRSDEKLTSLDTTGLSQLTDLDAAWAESLPALDLSTNVALGTLDVRGTAIAELDLTKNPGLTPDTVLTYSDTIKITYAADAAAQAVAEVATDAAAEPVEAEPVAEAPATPEVAQPAQPEVPSSEAAAPATPEAAEPATPEATESTAPAGSSEADGATAPEASDDAAPEGEVPAGQGAAAEAGVPVTAGAPADDAADGAAAEKTVAASLE